MPKKDLIPPFYRLTAICSVHGSVTVERKPRRNAGQRSESGGVEPAHSLSIVCPYCPFQARVTSTELVLSTN
jgi:hypothetical protein